MSKILVTGSSGQLGSVLVEGLRNKYGVENVIASDIRFVDGFNGNFELVDATEIESVRKVVKANNISQIYHLAAVLSANGERNPMATWDINMKSLLNVLEVSRNTGVQKVFFPSSIAVFGDQAPLDRTGNKSYLNPATVYGISKAAGENWCNYYYQKYGLDIRSLRYPGVIGYQSLPGGGTTDYAIDIFHSALRSNSYSCFLKGDTRLPMIFMDDAIRATLEIMEAPKEDVRIRTSYNLGAVSFSPKEIATEIKKHLPDFSMGYEPDFRQDIADNWPRSIDDSQARMDWKWNHAYDLEKMVATMISKLKEQYARV
ncbi:NAD-dependent epimerase/dehydratase family protein [Flagellimonas sp.]|uniref:NAD-dependent epimerase/dehydratase family protein n=1 Tax=Flagellimonas sp. TaxID=2058762 RepID=UPI003B52F615